MKVKDAAHAVRVLKALVEQGEKMLKDTTPAPWTMESDCDKQIEIAGPQKFYPGRTFIWVDKDDVAHDEMIKNAILIQASRSLVPALVEGAKAVLDMYADYVAGMNRMIEQKAPDDAMVKVNEACHVLRKQMLVLAQTYAPGMIEAGMEVPE